MQRPQTRLCHAPAPAPKALEHQLELCLCVCQSVCLSVCWHCWKCNQNGSTWWSAQLRRNGHCQLLFQCWRRMRTRDEWAYVTRARCNYRLGRVFSAAGLRWCCSLPVVACAHALLTHSSHMQIFAARRYYYVAARKETASVISCGRGKVPLHSTIHCTFVWPPKWRQITSMATLVIRLYASMYLCECLCVCVYMRVRVLDCNW